MINRRSSFNTSVVYSDCFPPPTKMWRRPQFGAKSDAIRKLCISGGIASQRLSIKFIWDETRHSQNRYSGIISRRRTRSITQPAACFSSFGTYHMSWFAASGIKGSLLRVYTRLLRGLCSLMGRQLEHVCIPTLSAEPSFSVWSAQSF